jgi:U3 small nucleolar RNA-associated protein 11
MGELSARLERDASLKDALLEIKNQRLRMQNGAKRLIDKSSSSPADRSESRGGDGNSKGFTFNTTAEDDSDDADEDSRHSNHEGKWKPKVYKWKFQRKR